MHTEFTQFSIWNAIALCISIVAIYFVIKAFEKTVRLMTDDTSFTPALKDLEMAEKRRKEGR